MGSSGKSISTQLASVLPWFGQASRIPHLDCDVPIELRYIDKL